MTEQIFNDTNSQNKDKEKEQSDNEEENNFVPFLSKDLFNQINTINEDEKDEKDEINFSEDKFTNIILNENDKHKIQEDLEDADLIYEENENDIDFNIFKQEKNKTNNNTKFSQENFFENNKNKENDSMPRVLSEQLNQSNFNKKFSNNGKRKSALNLGRYNDEKIIINNNNNYNNNIQNNINFINNSFSKNGRAGWICSACQNFNYESKYLIFFILNLFLINYFFIIIL